MGGLRSDSEAVLRCQVQVPLKKMQEQRLLEKVNIIPSYMTYTTMENASVFARAKSHHLSEEMSMLLEMVRDRNSVGREEIYDLSTVGRKATQEAVKALHRSGLLYHDHRWRVRAVPESDMEVEEARREVVRRLFLNFGVFSAENLQRFMNSEFPMKELRRILSDLEEKGLLVKGFLDRSSDSLYWMLAGERDSIGPPPHGSFVLTLMDNLYHYLRPWIKNSCDAPSSVIISGADIVGHFRARKQGNNLTILEFKGDREARSILTEYIKAMKLTLRGEEPTIIPDWEIQEFYEKTHPGSPKTDRG
jgi:ATP-dependent Lhr-like helicase